ASSTFNSAQPSRRRAARGRIAAYLPTTGEATTRGCNDPVFHRFDSSIEQRRRRRDERGQGGAALLASGRQVVRIRSLHPPAPTMTNPSRFRCRQRKNAFLPPKIARSA